MGEFTVLVVNNHKGFVGQKVKVSLPGGGMAKGTIVSTSKRSFSVSINGIKLKCGWSQLVNVGQS